MSIESFLRTIPLVSKHILRTRLLMHENRQFRKFLERNNIDPVDVIKNQFEAHSGITEFIDNNQVDSNIQTAFKSVAVALREEQKRAAKLEATLYVLQIDFDDLLVQGVRQNLEKNFISEETISSNFNNQLSSDSHDT